MILETLRMVRDGLEHAGTGVNAVLSTLPIDPGDTKPRRIERIVCAADTRDVAQLKVHDDPYIAVMQSGPAQMQGEVGQVTRDSDSLPVSVLYVTKRQGDEVVEESLYVIRAVVKAIRELMRSSREADRLRNGICILSTRHIVAGPTDEELGTGRIRAEVALDLAVRDTVA